MPFEAKKFFSGFNIFNGGVVGKLLYLAVIISIALGIYHFITRPTISSSNKNVITSPEQVNIYQGQRIENADEETLFVGVRWSRIKLGVTMLKARAKVKQDTKTEVKNDKPAITGKR